MSVHWNTVKSKLKMRRRQIVDVHLPEYDEVAAEARIDRESDHQRRSRLVPEVTMGLDRHQVRDIYREVFGAP